MLTPEEKAAVARLIAHAGLSPHLADEQVYVELAKKVFPALRTMVVETFSGEAERDLFLIARVVTRIIAESLEAAILEQAKNG